MPVTQNGSVVALDRSSEALTDVLIHSLSGLKQANNYMCFRAFYTRFNNIRLGFINIESKTDKEEARVKLAEAKWFT